MLDITYTDKDKKVQKIDAQIASVQKSYDAELASTLKRIKNDYEASAQQEKLLTGAYDSQSQRVGSRSQQDRAIQFPEARSGYAAPACTRRCWCNRARRT